ILRAPAFARGDPQRDPNAVRTALNRVPRALGSARRRHPLEIRDVLRRNIPVGSVFRVHDHLRRSSRQPTVILTRPGRAEFSPYTRTAAYRTEMPGIDVAAFGLRRVARRLSCDRHVITLEPGQGHVAGAGRALAVLAMALSHADGFRTDREIHGAAEAASRCEWLVRHDFSLAELGVKLPRGALSGTIPIESSDERCRK